jgi:hypothetical protein
MSFFIYGLILFTIATLIFAYCLQYAYSKPFKIELKESGCPRQFDYYFVCNTCGWYWAKRDRELLLLQLMVPVERRGTFSVGPNQILGTYIPSTLIDHISEGLCPGCGTETEHKDYPARPASINFYSIKIGRERNFFYRDAKDNYHTLQVLEWK